MSSPILAAYCDVRRAIDAACAASGRKPESVILVAVSKTYGPDMIQPVIDAGQRVFGENRVQEAKEKWPGLKNTTPGLELHLIGPLQSNKAAEAVALFDVIQTVDRDKIAQALSSEMAKQKRQPKLFVQINTGLEPQKAGIPPQDADAFLIRCRNLYGLLISGLMCIPPADEPARPHFDLLAGIARRNGLAELSMGMSADFKDAIAAGATCVRVGSAIFGARG